MDIKFDVARCLPSIIYRVAKALTDGWFELLKH